MSYLPNYYWEDEPAFICEACNDEGWLLDENDCAIPCTECCSEQILDDINEEISNGLYSD